jgi:hypothetical protein
VSVVVMGEGEFGRLMMSCMRCTDDLSVAMPTCDAERSYLRDTHIFLPF